MLKICAMQSLYELLWSTGWRYWKQMRNYLWCTFCKVSYICDVYKFACDISHTCNIYTFVCLRYLGERHHGIKGCLNSGFEKLAGIVVQEKSPRNHRSKYNNGPEIRWSTKLSTNPVGFSFDQSKRKVKPKDTSVDVAISTALIPTKKKLISIYI